MALSGARQQRRSESLVLRLGTKVRPWRSKTPRITPVLAAGVTDRPWTLADIITVLEAWEARQ